MFEDRNTIQSIKVSKVFNPIDFSKSSLKTFVSAITPMVHKSPVRVEDSALKFYAYNHILSKLETGGLPISLQEEFCNHYYKVLDSVASDMIAYIAVVTTRESRHANSGSIKGYVPSNLTQFFYDLPSKNSTSAVAHFFTLVNDTTGVTVGEYFYTICNIFYKGKFSAGFGGKPWWNIANTLYQLILGKYSYNVFLDLAWSLSHNNGLMFNKNVVYYPVFKDLLKVLDIQRSGQIPNFLGSGNKEGCIDNDVFMNAMGSQEIQFLINNFPSEFNKGMDWGEVAKTAVDKSMKKFLKNINNVEQNYDGTIYQSVKLFGDNVVVKAGTRG